MKTWLSEARWQLELGGFKHIRYIMLEGSF